MKSSRRCGSRRPPALRYEILLTQIDHNRLEFVVLRSSSTTLPCFFRALDRHFVFDARHHDLAVAHVLVLCTASRSPSRMPMSHRHAVHPQQEIGARF